MVAQPDRIRADIEATRGALADDVDRLADRANPKRMAGRGWEGVKGKVRSVGEQVMGTSQDTASSVAETASSAGDRVRAAGQDMADEIRDAPAAVTRQARGNPLAAGLIAFGVGLLAASLIPETEAEQRLGEKAAGRLDDLVEPVRQPLMEQGRQLGEQLGESAKQAAGQVKDAAADAAAATRDQAQRSGSQAAEQTREVAGP